MIYAFLFLATAIYVSNVIACIQMFEAIDYDCDNQIICKVGNILAFIPVVNIIAMVIITPILIYIKIKDS